ncbi:hypothetical protein P0W64_19910 [Tsukamurella sp. 8F]|uniref:hypothetical protein n=1 Tax=unclassified Tsukamurella TaxID=2633480 RepID=UPI0023B8DEE5|nr:MULTISPECIES: hypothetical protein [unclassified Tsukamurella]MDF0531812.1 hypothetical protein [Tsukamurella sp. 8J]MDF0589054.1 hypothetical protein [Tsukamurella sp. 8F]
MKPRAAVTAFAAALLVAACGPSTPADRSLSSTQSPAPSRTSSPSTRSQNPAPQTASPFGPPSTAPAAAGPASGYIPGTTVVSGTEGESKYRTTIPTLTGGSPAVVERFRAAVRAGQRAVLPGSEADGRRYTTEDGVVPAGFRTAVTSITPYLVSGLIVAESFAYRAAHPYTSIATIVIDTATASPIAFDDVFTDPATALARMRSLAPGLDGSRRLQDAGYDDFRDWLPRRDGFQAFVSVPFVLGSYIPVTVPWAKLSDLMRPGMLQKLSRD